ncbi:MAG: winged helix-turn-helix domain-containing protein [Nanoarchaeota archaeon]
MLKVDNQTLVLNEFFKTKKGEKGLQLRELGRKIGLAPTSVKKYLEELEKEGIIIREKKEKYPLYYPNTKNQQYLRLKNLHIIRTIHECGMIEHIEKTTKPTIIVLAGINFEEESKEIKLYIRGKAENLKLEEYEKGINTKIIPVISKDFKELSPSEEKELINGIVIKGIIEINSREEQKDSLKVTSEKAKGPLDEEDEGYYTRTLIKSPENHIN